MPKAILDATVFINIPKLKTHRKAGVTLSLKNLIGILGDKTCIAHHRRKKDEYEKFDLWEYSKWYFKYFVRLYMPTWFITGVYKIYKTIFLGGRSLQQANMEFGVTPMEGNWYGNDTIWRSIVDVNNILFFADKKGQMQSLQQRKYLTIIDGIIGMQKEGPLEGVPKECGLLIGGFHPTAVDAIAAGLMGFDHRKITAIRKAFKDDKYNLTPFSYDDIRVYSKISPSEINSPFQPSKRWIGKIEREMEEHE
jgi:hypothetical protein